MTRVLLGLMAAASIAATGAIVGLAAGRGGGPAVEGAGFAGALAPRDAPVRDFRLRDQDGRSVGLRDFRGQVVVVTFLYSTCEDTCPITAQQIRGALDLVGRDVPVLAVSVDPAQDTPEHARRFLLEQKLTGRMRFLLGSRAELGRVWRAYGIQPQGRGFEHTAHVLVLDRRGRQRVGFPIDHLTPEGLAHDLRRLM